MNNTEITECYEYHYTDGIHCPVQLPTQRMSEHHALYCSGRPAKDLLEETVEDIFQ